MTRTRRIAAAIGIAAVAASGGTVLATGLAQAAPAGGPPTPEEECLEQGGSWDGERCIFDLDTTTTTSTTSTTTTTTAPPAPPVVEPPAEPAPAVAARGAERRPAFTG
jgi:hypothetical protein